MEIELLRPGMGLWLQVRQAYKDKEGRNIWHISPLCRSQEGASPRLVVSISVSAQCSVVGIPACSSGPYLGGQTNKYALSYTSNTAFASG